ncbi:hypothetical protein AK812_SmicGene13087 [Symbiodinium microadriaticum]|uniref:C2H2-type domain-containing protein n=1 Tax=Symbiodinium microadriaticum TaxID=2951 RepID=A0A1Q9E912_SYMMI|nr:hypothetical protein AK812_SmicGene13087 [Symbiodinium microadriaticum]
MYREACNWMPVQLMQQTVWSCRACRKTFRSKGGLGAHFFKTHQRLAVYRHCVDGTMCRACGGQFWTSARLGTHLRDNPGCVARLLSEGLVAAQPGHGSRGYQKRLVEEFNLAPAIHDDNAGQIPFNEVWSQQQKDAYRSLCAALSAQSCWDNQQQLVQMFLEQLATFPLYFQEEKDVIQRLHDDIELLERSSETEQWDANTFEVIRRTVQLKEEWLRPYLPITVETSAVEKSAKEFIVSYKEIEWEPLTKAVFQHVTPERIPYSLDASWEAKGEVFSGIRDATAVLSDPLCCLPGKIRELWQQASKGDAGFNDTDHKTGDIGGSTAAICCEENKYQIQINQPNFAYNKIMVVPAGANYSFDFLEVNGSVVFNGRKCFSFGPFCGKQSILDVFKDDDYIIRTLTAEGARMAINEWEDQENFCPLTIAVDNSPCFNSNCQKYDTVQERNDCRTLARSYCATSCPDPRNMDTCKAQLCPLGFPFWACRERNLALKRTEDLDEKRALQEKFRKFLDPADAKLEKISDRLGIVKAETWENSRSSQSAQLDDARKADALVGLVIRSEGITQDISRDWSIDYTCHPVRPCSYRGSSLSEPAAAINFEGMTFPGFFFAGSCAASYNPDLPATDVDEALTSGFLVSPKKRSQAQAFCICFSWAQRALKIKRPKQS